MPRRCSERFRRRASRRGRSPQREDQLQGPRAFARQGAGAARCRQARGGRAHGVGAAARQPGAAGAAARCRHRRARGRSGAARSAGVGPRARRLSPPPLMTPTRPILTIGHSRHSWERFAALLAGAGVETLADIRSVPRSRFSPHFNKDALAAALAARNVEYIFLGKELGGRPQESACIPTAWPITRRWPRHRNSGSGSPAEEAAARAQLGRDVLRSRSARMPPMPAGRSRLARQGVDVRHILASGEVMTHAEAEDRLLELERSRRERLAGPLARGARLPRPIAHGRAKPPIALPSPNKSKKLLPENRSHAREINCLVSAP